MYWKAESLVMSFAYEYLERYDDHCSITFSLHSSFLYKFFKIVMVLWLIHPDFRGALYLYHRLIESLFERLKDSFFEKMYVKVAALTGFSDSLLEKLQTVNTSSASGSASGRTKSTSSLAKDPHSHQGEV